MSPDLWLANLTPDSLSGDDKARLIKIAELAWSYRTLQQDFALNRSTETLNEQHQVETELDALLNSPAQGDLFG